MSYYSIEGSDQRFPVSYRIVSPSGVVAAALAFALAAGTGGTTDPTYFQKRGDRGYQFVQISSSPTVSSAIHSPIENLERIRAAFKPSIQELSGALKVSRQAVYNWISGELPSAERADRLEDLARAADVVEAHGIVTPYLLRRKIRDGKNLMDIVREGGSAHEAALSLVRIARREAEQRDLLRSRLAGRKPLKVGNSEFGVPSLGE